MNEPRIVVVDPGARIAFEEAPPFVVIESPYAGDVEGNLAYLEACMRDVIGRGEIPYASHRLYPGVLSDRDPVERLFGVSAGFLTGTAFAALAGVTVAFYVDRGLSRGMGDALIYWKALAQRPGMAVNIEVRELGHR